jgi:hypothetical protein
MASERYDLYLLGWHSFQQLCLSITREILGQTVESFLDSNDAGKDGAFSGTWKSEGQENITGNFVIQCKFTGKKDAKFSLSDLNDEYPKIEKLQKAGRCDCYVVLTNAGISGQLDEKIKQKLFSLGIKHVLLFGTSWICDQIHQNRNLRTSVPRLYGLGDLGQIIDERAYNQAKALLATLRDDLSKIVITNSYRKASEAVNNHSFVLLIGEPAAGKTTIASLLAISALDQWGAFTIKIDTPYKIIEHWNSQNPAQFFWIDDAFGVTQYESSLVHSWNHIIPQIRAMLKQGVKIVMTSRDYIYNRARNDLKEGAFPLFQESQVVIDVHELTSEEKDQILYNHLKLGRQSIDFRLQIKPFLSAIAAHPRFVPETARRLAEPLFTKELFLSEYLLSEYVEKQEHLLQEVIQNLDVNSKSALALIYMRNDRLESPVELTSTEAMSLLRLGSNVSGVIEALQALNGSIVQFVRLEDNPIWRFKHPTVSDAYASMLIKNPEWLDIYIAGTATEKMLDQITCGDVGIQKALIIPQKYFPVVSARLREFSSTQKYKSTYLSAWGAKRQLHSFLSRRCSKEFLRTYLAENPDFLNSISTPELHLSYSSEVDLVTRLHKFQILPEDKRQQFVKSLTDYAIEGEDVYALEDEECRGVFTEDELKILHDRVFLELIPNLQNVRHGYESSFNDSDDPEEHIERFIDTLKTLKTAYPDDSVKIIVDKQVKEAEDWIQETTPEYKPEKPKRELSKVQAEPEFSSTRSIFDDIDE